MVDKDGEAPGLDEATERHLDLLGTLHYTMAGLQALVGSLPLIHLVVGIGMLTGAIQDDGPDGAILPYVGAVVVVFSTLVVAFGWSMAIANVLAGGRLKERTRHRFCQIVSALNCLMVPLGTVLGVSTLLALQKPGVKEAFEGEGSTAARTRQRPVTAVRPQAGATRCPYCHEEAAADGDACACTDCLSRHHVACWEELGHCASCQGDGRLLREGSRLEA